MFKSNIFIVLLTKIILCRKIFYWSHLLYIPFWILMIFHGPNFWKWFIGPGIIYLVEKIRRLIWLRSQRGKTYISSGLLLPSKVTHLVIKRPSNFHFHPGDYVFVKSRWLQDTNGILLPLAVLPNKKVLLIFALWLMLFFVYYLQLHLYTYVFLKLIFNIIMLFLYRLYVVAHPCGRWVDQ